MSGPRLLRTQGPRLLDTQGPRLLKTEGPRLLRTAEGPRLLKTQTRSVHTEGPRLLRTQGPRLLRTQGPRLLKTQSRNLHGTGATSSSALLTSDQTIYGSLGPRLPASEATPFTHETGNSLRYFNTSRSLKAVNDTSTIDFTFVPDFDPAAQTAPTQIRVPIVLSTATSAATQAAAAEAEQPVVQPTISTVAADGTHIHASKPVDEVEGMARQIWRGFVDDIFGPKHGGASKA